MKNELHKFQKYPLPQEKLSWLDKLRIKTHFGGIARCNVCGSLTILYVRGTTLRESCTCIRCHSWSRQRQVAYVVCQAISAVKQKSIHPIKDLARLDDLVIYNTEADRATHKQLAGMRNYIASEYFGSTHQSGEIVNNIVRQDLMNLSLKNESVDLILSSDVFEHIPDPYKAHREVYRVLKKGGRHVFTVPFYEDQFLDEIRASMDSDGKIIHLKEPQYHGDPLNEKGVLVYTVFSLEMLVKLREIGFQTNMYELHKTWFGILGNFCLVFEAIKL